MLSTLELIAFLPPIIYTFLTFDNFDRVTSGILSLLVNKIGAFVTPDNPLALNPSDKDLK